MRHMNELYYIYIIARVQENIRFKAGSIGP